MNINGKWQEWRVFSIQGEMGEDPQEIISSSPYHNYPVVSGSLWKYENQHTSGAIIATIRSDKTQNDVDFFIIADNSGCQFSHSKISGVRINDSYFDASGYDLVSGVVEKCFGPSKIYRIDSNTSNNDKSK